MLNKTGKSFVGILLAMLMLLPAGAWATGGMNYSQLNLGTGALTGEWTIDGMDFTENELTLATESSSPHKYRYYQGFAVPGARDKSSELRYTAPKAVKASETDKYIMTASGMSDERRIASDFLVRGLHTFVSSPIQAWEIRVKMPDEGANTIKGETRLFLYGVNATDQNGYTTNPYNMSTSPVLLKNGGVYLADGFSYDESAEAASWVPESGIANPGYTMEQCLIPEGSLEADKWYRFVRLMDLRNKATHMQKVMVYDENDAFVAESNWIMAGMDINPNSDANILYTMSFFTHNYLTETGVMFDDLQIYNLTAPEMTAKAAAGANINKVGKLDNFTDNVTTMRNNSVVSRPSIFSSVNENASLSIKVNLPDVAGSKVGLFGIEEGSVTGNNQIRPSNALVVIKNGEVYCRVDEPVTVYDTKKASEYLTYGYEGYAARKLDNLTLSSNTWYEFRADVTLTAIDGNTNYKSGAFTVKVLNAAGSVLAQTAFTKNVKYRAGSTVGLIYIGINENHPCPVYFDDINCVGSSGTTTKAAAEDFQTAEIGENNLREVLTASLGTLYQPTSSPTAVPIAQGSVADDPTFDFIYTGIVNSSTPPAVELSFSADMDADCFTKDNIYLEAYGSRIDINSVSYSAADKKATVDLGTLGYGTTYKLVVRGLTESQGLFSAPNTEYSFTVVSDPFAVTSKSFLNEDNTEAADATVSAGGKVKGRVELKNNSAQLRNYLVILVLYSNGEMQDITFKSGSMIAGVELSGENAIVTDTLTAGDRAATAALMVWDNWVDMKPLMPVKTLPTELQ